MSDENNPKKKDKETDPMVKKNSTHINVDGSIGTANLFAGTAHKGNLDITGKAYDLGVGATLLNNNYSSGRISINPVGDIGTHIFAETQPITFATQAGILGTTARLGENLLEMKINTIGDARNFLVGVNNVASIFSANSGLLQSIESASAIALNNSRLTVEAINKINIPSVTSGLHLATEYHLKSNEVLRLSESVTTVLAYGQAIQNQFSPITSVVLDHNPTHINLGGITSPYIFEPQKIKTKEVEKVLPEVKKDLPVKTTEAIELMEYVFNPDTKNDDKKITTTVAELKRALKNMQGSVLMFMQHTTQKVEITSMPLVQIKDADENILVKNKKKISLPKFKATDWGKIEIKFINENYVYIKADKKTVTVDYDGLGFCNDKNGKPNTAWKFLFELSKNNGETKVIDSPIPDNIKQHKKTISDKLKTVFKNDTGYWGQPLFFGLPTLLSVCSNPNFFTVLYNQ